MQKYRILTRNKKNAREKRVKNGRKLTIEKRKLASLDF